jgi:hypothetical protein
MVDALAQILIAKRIFTEEQLYDKLKEYKTSTTRGSGMPANLDNELTLSGNNSSKPIDFFQRQGEVQHGCTKLMTERQFIAESRILRRISAILSQAGISHYVDPKIKRFASNRPYLGIYKTRRCLLFTHYYQDSYIQAIIPKITSPGDIRNVFGIEGEDNWGDNYKSKTHYVFDIPLMNEKLNGKWTVEDKAYFFVQIAQGR